MILNQNIPWSIWSIVCKSVKVSEVSCHTCLCHSLLFLKLVPRVLATCIKCLPLEHEQNPGYLKLHAALAGHSDAQKVVRFPVCSTYMNGKTRTAIQVLPRPLLASQPKPQGMSDACPAQKLALMHASNFRDRA